MAGQIPRGWSYNPSSWSERLPIVGLALIGCGVAGYLTLYQLRIISSVWDPFFGLGSTVILNSPVSRLLPVPDAGLGAFSYLLDALAGVIGGRARWRTMPWIVIVFGLFVGPLGAVSITLVILQPVLFGAWCTLCLTSAAISLLMIGPAMDELLASLQYLKRTHEAGGSLWSAFWGGAPAYESATQAEPAPRRGQPSRAPVWPEVVAVLGGLWLMLAPDLLGAVAAARTNDRIVGPLVVSVAVVAIWDVTRPLRWLLVPLGAWLLLAPWLLGYHSAETVSSLAVGVVLIVAATFRGRVVERFDGGWSSLFEDRGAPAPSGAGRPA